MRHLAQFFVLLLFTVRGVAEPTKFVEHNFSIEIPPGWSAMNSQPPQALLAVQSPDKTHFFLVSATKIPSPVHSDVARELEAGAKDSSIKAGCKIDPAQNISLGGVSFVYFIAHAPSDRTLTSYTAVAGDQAYMLQAISKQPDAEADTQMQSALQSFKLLRPALPPADSWAIYQFGVHSVRIVIVLVVGIVVIGGVSLGGYLMLGRRK